MGPKSCVKEGEVECEFEGAVGMEKGGALGPELVRAASSCCRRRRVRGRDWDVLDWFGIRSEGVF